MEESFEQKVIRNVKAGGFAVYKTPEVVGGKTMLSNVEWEDPEQVDKFFAFAKSLGARVVYVSESEDEPDPTTGQAKTVIVQVGFLHGSVMHHINLEEDEEDEDEDEEDEDEDDEEYEEDEDGEYEESDNEDEEYEDEETVEESPQQTIPSQGQAQQAPVSQNPQQQIQQPPSESSSQPAQQWPKPKF